MNLHCDYQLDIPPEGIQVSTHLHHTIHTGMQQQFPIFCQSASSGSSMLCTFWKNHIMRNLHTCKNHKTVLRGVHWRTFCNPYEDKTTLLGPGFQNWFHAVTPVWVPPTHWTGLSKSVLMDLVCPAWSCPTRVSPHAPSDWGLRQGIEMVMFLCCSYDSSVT